MKILYRDIQIFDEKHGVVRTAGLNKSIHAELLLKSFGNVNGEVSLIQFMIDYILDTSPKIHHNETISYGLWLLKFLKTDNCFEIFELDEKFETWQSGADNAIYYIEQQKELCKSEAAKFDLPLFTQKIVVSEGVFEGLSVQGIRYSEPPHMSGWYVTTSLYRGDIKTLKVVPLQEFVIRRKDLLQFLALPSGYVFETTDINTCRIWKAPTNVENN